MLRAVVRYRLAGNAEVARGAARSRVGNDRWEGSFAVSELGRWQFTIEAWVDLLRDDPRRARPQARRRPDRARERACGGRGALRAGELEGWHVAAPALGAKDRHGKASLDRPLEVDVDRERARFGAWYELFPRSWGGFAGVEKVRPAARGARLRRDLPPAGASDRDDEPQGPQQRARGGEGRSRAARGRSAGRRAATTRCTPSSGRWRSSRASSRPRASTGSRSRSTSRSSAHPTTRGSSSIRTGSTGGRTGRSSTPRTRPSATRTSTTSTSTPPDWRGLWEALRDVVLHWCRHGVRAFRVDNPHTKSVPFWEWLIAEVRAEFPDAIFLSEAFTRPAMMKTLAKIGFSQSYTYFTWKNTKGEIVEFVEQLLGWAAYYRPNFFVNTPDILHEYLQTRRPARLRGAARARGDALALLRHLLRLRELRERARRAGERGVPRLGEVRGEVARRSTGRCSRSCGG